jgi:hypothetical protein
MDAAKWLDGSFDDQHNHSDNGYHQRQHLGACHKQLRAIRRKQPRRYCDQCTAEPGHDYRDQQYGQYLLRRPALQLQDSFGTRRYFVRLEPAERLERYQFRHLHYGVCRQQRPGFGHGLCLLRRFASSYPEYYRAAGSDAGSKRNNFR